MPTEAARDRKSTEPARGPRLSKPRRVRTPTVLQMEAVECGAAALAIVLGYYRRFVPLEELRVACGVSRDGSKASNILKAARTYGLHAKGYKKDIPAAKELQPPFIAFWNFNHFVVVNGFGNKQVFLNDPGVGPRTVTDVEFDLAFTGVVLVFETTPEFRREGAPPRALAALLSRLKGSRVALFYIVLATFALALPNLIVPIFSRLYIDDVLIAGKRTWLGPLMVAMASAAVIKAVLVYLQQSVLLTTETKVSIISSARFFWHVLMMPMEFFSQRYAGEVTSRIQLNDRLAALLSGELASSAANLLFIGIFVFLMARFDIVLTLIALCAACLNLAALQYIARRRRDQNIRLMQEKGKLIGITMSTLQMIETVKSTGSESDYFSRWAGYQAKVVNAEQALGYSSHVLGSVPILLTALTAVAVLGIGGFRVINGALTIGALIALQALIASFMDPVNSLINLGATIQEVQGDLGRLDDVMRYPPDPIAVRSRGLLMTEAHDRLEGYLELKNITFGYSRLEPALLNNFSLSLRPGQRVALIGGSGSGKSTVAKLVAGLYEPWSGEILFDGLRRADIRKDVLTSSVSLVDQEVFLFEGSVRRNLTLWDDSVEEAVLLLAAEDAVIHEDIVGRLGGYDSLLEEEGRNFSGGQRQRMEIARALMGGPRLLILDEATSALDPRVEEMISEGLRRRGCSCLIVAHRLSTIRDADEIIVLDRGAIVQRGTHEEMRAVPGPYATLLKTE